MQWRGLPNPEKAWSWSLPDKSGNFKKSDYFAFSAGKHASFLSVLQCWNERRKGFVWRLVWLDNCHLHEARGTIPKVQIISHWLEAVFPDFLVSLTAESSKNSSQMSSSHCDFSPAPEKSIHPMKESTQCSLCTLYVVDPVLTMSRDTNE